MSVALLLSPRSSEGPRIVGPFDDPDAAIGYLAGLCLESPEYQVTWSIVPITDPDPSKDPVPGFTPPICSWRSNPIHGDAEGEASTGRVHHARDECPSPPGWPERG